LALILAGLVAWWLQQSMRLVTRYTQSLAQDEKKPYFYLGRELNELTDTIEEMKHRLENRAYVTDYVHTLTHELKSPITAIRACGELLEDTQLEEDDRLMLSQTISEQSIKLQSLIDRLLLLAKIEQPTFKLNLELLNISALVTQLLTHNESQRLNYQVAIILDDQTDTQVML
ncbi:histidine kinase dimerization/phospho-acceptor domain-containing protein, partial [Flavobacterium sp. I-STPA6A]